MYVFVSTIVTRTLALLLFCLPLMYFRKHLLESGKALASDGDTTVEMDGTGILNALLLHLDCQNDNDLMAKGRQFIIEHLTEVNIVGDGRDDILSLTGEELVACAIYDQKKFPSEMGQTYGNKYQRIEIPVNFGRFFKDTKMGLNIGKWDNLDLTFTFDDFSTSHFGTTINCRVSQLFMEDLTTSPRHWIRRIEQKKDKPSAAGQWVRYTVPSDMLLRRLMILLDPDLTAATNTPTAYPTGDSYKFSLSFLNGKEKLYVEEQVKAIMRENSQTYGKFVRGWHQSLNTSIYIDTQMGYLESLVVGPIIEGTGADTTLPSMPDEQGRFVLPKFAGTADHFSLIATGWGPFSTFIIPFDQEGIEGYLNTKVKHPVKVDWYGHAADHAFRMVTEELAVN